MWLSPSGCDLDGVFLPRELKSIYRSVLGLRTDARAPRAPMTHTLVKVKIDPWMSPLGFIRGVLQSRGQNGHLGLAHDDLTSAAET